MYFDVGQYRMSLPSDAQVLESKRFPPTDAEAARAQVGPFEVSAQLLDASLEDWKSHVASTTKGQTKTESIEVNGIPGLTLLGAFRSRRMDYFFEAPGGTSISIVAWSDSETSAEQQGAVETVVGTLVLRAPWERI